MFRRSEPMFPTTCDAPSHSDSTKNQGEICSSEDLTVAHPRGCSRPLSRSVASVRAPHCIAADLWGGSLALTSDYFVRGISRSNDHAALQLDLHYVNTSGFLAGLFASNTQIDPGEPRDAESVPTSVTSGLPARDWHGKILGTYYSYPWNQAGSQYNYDEVDLDVAYQGWLDVRLAYSPTRPVTCLRVGLIAVSAESAELNVQRPLIGKLSGTRESATTTWRGRTPPVIPTAAPAPLTTGPRSLWRFPMSAPRPRLTHCFIMRRGGRWTGTVIWRF